MANPDLLTPLLDLVKTSPFAYTGWRVAVYFINKHDGVVRELIDAWKTDSARCHEDKENLKKRVALLEELYRK